MAAIFIQQLREDHEKMRGFLARLDEQRDALARGRSPDWSVMEGVARYALEHPDRFHHPQEDMIFERLRVVSPSDAAQAGDLLSQHTTIAAEARRLGTAVKAARAASAVADGLAGQIGEFVDLYRRHMAQEEELFFPAAERSLRDADWRILHADWALRQTAGRRST